MAQRTCVDPAGHFIVGVHRPRFEAINMRCHDQRQALGQTQDGLVVDNGINFPAGSVQADDEDWLYEIANPFPFRGATFIVRRFAERAARRLSRIALPEGQDSSLSRTLKAWLAENKLGCRQLDDLIERLPPALRLALATISTDPEDLERLARVSCRFVPSGNDRRPQGLLYAAGADGHASPVILDKTLYKAVANNPFLPDDFKRAMVLRPGAQGTSEIVGEFGAPGQPTHIYEYLRRNSYIPWGHYAANMADDAVRYRLADLSRQDICGLRQLYYQRTYIRLAQQLGIPVAANRRVLTTAQTEALRVRIMEAVPAAGSGTLHFNSVLWGWNFGADISASGYRLHGSHQQIHQQFAMVPDAAEPLGAASKKSRPGIPSAFACGDLVGDFVTAYRKDTGRGFFEAYQQAIENNERIDGRREKERQLVVYEDSQVMLFVPKAQTSQWELQLMPKHPVGNVVEADTAMRDALDTAMHAAMKALSGLGARMITSIELSKRIGPPGGDQRLLYCFLPRLPESPGAFSEAQLRWINGHYPEDFAAVCRRHLSDPGSAAV